MKKVVIFVKTGHFSAFRLCTPCGKRPFSGDFRGLFRPSRSLSEEKRRVLRVQRTAEGPEKEANEGGYSIYINRNAKLALPDFSVFSEGKL